MKKLNQFTAICLALAVPGCTVDTDPGSGGGGTNFEPESVEETVKAGGTASTSGGKPASEDDPVESSVTSPKGGKVTIDEGPVDPEDAPDGFKFFGQQVNITAPAGTPEEPLVLEFDVHTSVLPEGADAESVDLFRNSKLVPPGCTGDDGVAEPDPCVADLTVDGDNLNIVALTSRASAWYFGLNDFFNPAIIGPTPKAKAVVDEDELTAGDWPVALKGKLGTVTVPFKKALPEGDYDLASLQGAVNRYVSLVVKSPRTGVTVSLTEGKPVSSGPPELPGEWSATLNGARDELSLTFYNEDDDGLTLKAGVPYEVQLSILDNLLVESVDPFTFTVLPTKN